MKHGKRPTKKQQTLIKHAGLDPINWLIAKNLNDEMLLVHRFTGQTRTIYL
jgi:hypothetical protein